jgi:hypothetical protein
LYLTYSSYNENINVLEKLTKNTMPLKVIFPQTEGVILHILPEIIGLTGLGNMKIVTLSNMRKEKVMDAYFSKLNAITIEIEEPYTSLFDITFDRWSLNGYIAAKLKAQEMCEGLTMKRATGVSRGITTGCNDGLITRTGTISWASGLTRAGATRTRRSSMRASSRGTTASVSPAVPAWGTRTQRIASDQAPTRRFLGA